MFANADARAIVVHVANVELVISDHSIRPAARHLSTVRSARQLENDPATIPVSCPAFQVATASCGAVEVAELIHS